MAENDITVTPEMAKRLNTDLLDICTDMLSIQAILESLSADGRCDHLHVAINALSMRSGAIADGISKRLGGIQSKGNLYEWFEMDQAVA
jgi:hypothetical protein